MQELHTRAAADRRQEQVRKDVSGQRTAWSVDDPPPMEGDRPATRSRGNLAHPERDVRGGFFGWAWFIVAGVVVLAGAATGSGGLAVIGLLALLTAGLAWAWARFALGNVTVTAALDHDHVLPGDHVRLTVTVVNRKLLPVPWTTLEVELPRSLRVGQGSRRRMTGEQVLRLSTALAPFGRLTWRSDVVCPIRGQHRVTSVSVRAGDPFGFFTVRLPVEPPAPVVVYPVVMAVSPLPDARLRQGDVRVQRNLYRDPTRIAGVRDYQPGDPFRMISWKATARIGTLQTRVEEPATSRQVLVCVDLETFGQLWQGVNAIQAETMIATAASILTRADASGYAVGVVANGLMPGTPNVLHIPAARGPGQLGRCLDALGRLNVLAAVPFDRTIAVLTGANRGVRGATPPRGEGLVVVVTSWLSDDDRLALLALSRSGRRVVVAPVPAEDGSRPDAPGLPTWPVETEAIRERITESMARRRASAHPSGVPDVESLEVVSA